MLNSVAGTKSHLFEDFKSLIDMKSFGLCSVVPPYAQANSGQTQCIQTHCM